MCHSAVVVFIMPFCSGETTVSFTVIRQTHADYAEMKGNVGKKCFTLYCRSHYFAFSIDGNAASLVMSGCSETETQQWMQHIRDLLWPRSAAAAAASRAWTKHNKGRGRKIEIDV